MEAKTIEIGLLVVVPKGIANIEHDWQTVPVELPVEDNFEQVALAIGTSVLETLRAKGILLTKRVEKPEGE